MRGTPILVQIYAAYFLLPLMGIKLSPFWIGIVALTFNSAGYQIEIARAAILSIDNGQYEGAFSLGLGKMRTLLSIILPQAFLRMLPPMANEMSNLIKASSVLSVITVFELHKAANAIISDTFKFLEMLFAQAVAPSEKTLHCHPSTLQTSSLTVLLTAVVSKLCGIP